MFKTGDEVRGVGADIRGYEGIIVSDNGYGYRIKITKQPRGGGHGTIEWSIGNILKRETYWEDSLELINHINIIFKVGDTVKCVARDPDAKNGDQNLVIGDIYKVIKLSYVNDNQFVCVRGNGIYCEGTYTGYFELINHKNNMSVLTSKIKRLFNKKKQLQYKAGFIDECGAKTALGNEEFEVLVDEFHEDSFTERAAEKIKEDKEAENKK